jgi:hypothetical protein
MAEKTVKGRLYHGGVDWGEVEVVFASRGYVDGPIGGFYEEGVHFREDGDEDDRCGDEAVP